jgi:hypothetical protein
MRSGVILPGGTALEQLEQAVLAEHPAAAGLEVVAEGETPHNSPERLHQVRERISAGPPG